MSDIPIGPGDVVPAYPEAGQIKLGILSNMFVGGPPCGRLHKSSFGPFFQKLVNADKKAAYLTWLLGQGWFPVDPANFGKPGFLLSMRLRRAVCPWYQYSAAKIAVDIDFNEFINVLRSSYAPRKTVILTWNRETDFDETVTSNAVPDPQLGSNGPWSARIRITRVVDPTTCQIMLHFQVDLVSTGWDSLVSGDVTETNDVVCPTFSPGSGGIPFGWTAVGPFDLGEDLPPSIGLVRGFFLGLSHAGYVA